MLRYVLIALIILIPSAYALPQGFEQTTIIGSGLNSPTEFELSPDGRIFILEKGGNVRVYDNGLKPNPLISVDVDSEGEKGLLGIAFDHEYSSNRNVYLYYIGSDHKPTVARYNVDTGTGHVIYKAEQESLDLHHGGTVRLGPDGKLYVAIGDNGHGPNAQDRSNVRGSVIRINTDGSIPSDNPFTDGKREIWAHGLRNPFRFQFDDETGRLYLGDVGDNEYEEINLIEKGKNYGWPTCEGPCGVEGMTNPIYSYPLRVNGGYISSSIVAGPVYRDDKFPEGFQGSLFIGDYARGWIKHMRLAPDGSNNGVYPFEDNAGTVVDMHVGSDGELYYLTIFPGKLLKVDHVSGNRAPIAVADANPKQGEVPLTVQFTSEGTHDPEGDSLTYDWDFGDGTSSSSLNPTKTYNSAGRYESTLTVSDGDRSSSDVVVIQAGAAPSVTINSPADGSFFRAGDDINYDVDVSDGVSEDNIFIRIDLHHSTHIHPFVERTGSSGSVNIPTEGHTEHDIWYRIYATARNSEGLKTTKFVEIFPMKSDISFRTEPAGFTVELDGRPTPTPFTETGVEGVSREVHTYYINHYNSETYVFDGWSDGGTRTHRISTPVEDTEYVAHYRKAEEGFRAEYFDNMDLAGEPDVVRNDLFIDFNWGSEYSPDPMIPGDGFSARWSKTESFDDDTYRFSVTSDDGVRVMVDGNVVFEDWRDGFRRESFDIEMAGGDHEIVVEYYESSGPAMIDVNWRKSSDAEFSSWFYLGSGINEWWQEINPQPDDGDIVQVYVRINEDQWVPMERSEWGNWVSNLNTPDETPVEFLVRDSQGRSSQSPVFWWITGASSSRNVALTSFPAQFYLGSGINNWWAEVNAESPDGVSRVEMRINGGEWMDMERKDWGNWASNVNIESGSVVQFRSYDSAGRIAMSYEYVWP